MPIHCPIPIAPLSKADVEAIDSVVMNCAYASQNLLGRLCEERVYENDLAARLRAEGVKDVHTQVPISVSHNHFTKVYRLDLVVNQMVYELKAVDALISAHEAQVYNYAALLGIPFTKLLNFGQPSVVGKLKASPFADTDRFAVTVDRRRWKALSEPCERLALDAS
jgi:GxxExxY protein